MNTSKKTGKPVGRKVAKQTTTKGRQTVTAEKQPESENKTKTKPEPKRQKGHWGIVAGTRKESVAKALDAEGLAAAMATAATLAVKEATVRAWAGAWRRAGLWVVAGEEAAK